MKKKKFMALGLAVIMAISTLAGCGTEDGGQSVEGTSQESSASSEGTLQAGGTEGTGGNFVYTGEGFIPSLPKSPAVRA